MIDHYEENYNEFWSDLRWMQSVGLGITVGGEVYPIEKSIYGGWVKL